VLDKTLSKNDLMKIDSGIIIDDEKVIVDRVSWIENKDDKREVGIELHSGKNRIVRRIFESLDYKVIKLDRVMFAGLTKKDLPRGKWRHLKQEEVNFLKMK
jgi:23S rRNA pseudouridine2605 synthase